jgi:hypothetical protein
LAEDRPPWVRTAQNAEVVRFALRRAQAEAMQAGQYRSQPLRQGLRLNRIREYSLEAPDFVAFMVKAIGISNDRFLAIAERLAASAEAGIARLSSALAVAEGVCRDAQLVHQQALEEVRAQYAAAKQADDAALAQILEETEQETRTAIAELESHGAASLREAEQRAAVLTKQAELADAEAQDESRRAAEADDSVQAAVRASLDQLSSVLAQVSVPPARLRPFAA